MQMSKKEDCQLSSREESVCEEIFIQDCDVDEGDGTVREEKSGDASLRSSNSSVHAQCRIARGQHWIDAFARIGCSRQFRRKPSHDMRRIHDLFEGLEGKVVYLQKQFFPGVPHGMSDYSSDRLVKNDGDVGGRPESPSMVTGSLDDIEDDDTWGPLSVDGNYISEEEMVCPERLHRRVVGGHEYERKLAVQYLLGALRRTVERPDAAFAINAFVEIFDVLFNDPVVLVRHEFLQQVPHLAMLCHQNKEILGFLMKDHLLPHTVQAIMDPVLQVRKTASAALVVVVEQGLIESDDFTTILAPDLCELTKAGKSEEGRIEVVSLMVKMSPLVGEEMTDWIFLNTFCMLCEDSSLQMRITCASHFPDMSHVLGPRSTEIHLLSKFIRLCEDQEWPVRKACAGVFTSFAANCRLETKKNSLTPIFVSLLKDPESRCVRAAAFQNLGGFISSFSSPLASGFILVDGKLHPLGRLHSFENYSQEQEVSGRELEDHHHHHSGSDSGNVEGEGGNKEDSDVTGNSPDEGFHESENGSLEDPDLEKEQGPSTDTVIAGVDAFQEECQVHSASCTSNISEGMGVPVIGIPLVVSITSNTGNSLTSEEASVPNEEGTTEHSTEGKKPEEPVVVPDEEAFNDFSFWKMPVPDVEPPKEELELVQDLDDFHISQDAFCRISFHQNVDSSESRQARLPTYSEMVKMGRSHATKRTNPESISAAFLAESFFRPSSLEEPLPIYSRDMKERENRDVMSFPERGQAVHLVMSDEEEDDMTITSLFDAPITPLPRSMGSGNYGSSISQFPWEVQKMEPQDLVPMPLLELFVSMTDSEKCHSVDGDVVRFCAFNFPAVAMALGKKYWGYIRETFHVLAGNMQWKVRRPLAFCMHHLAVILGPEIAANDLAPVFASFMSDVDEVRMGILCHYAEFLKVLPDCDRAPFHCQLPEFLKPEDSFSNWRLRVELSHQLPLLAALNPANSTEDTLQPPHSIHVEVALHLLCDRVFEVQQAALSSLCQILKHLRVTRLNDLCLRNLIKSITGVLLNGGKKWRRRQQFAKLCERVVADSCLPPDVIMQELIPHLLELVCDRVPNIRMAVAQALQVLRQMSWLEDQWKVLDPLNFLSRDPDQDVRRAAAIQQEHLTEPL